MGTQDAAADAWKVLAGRVDDHNRSSYPEELRGFLGLGRIDQENAVGMFERDKLMSLPGYQQWEAGQKWQKDWAAYEAEVVARKRVAWDDLSVEKRVGKYMADPSDPELSDWFHGDPAAVAHGNKVVEQGMTLFATLGPGMVGTPGGGAAAQPLLRASARKLAARLILRGLSRPAGAAAHHIVAGASPKAEAARRILQKFGIGIRGIFS
jgi:hypothetical protein